MREEKALLSGYFSRICKLSLFKNTTLSMSMSVCKSKRKIAETSSGPFVLKSVDIPSTHIEKFRKTSGKRTCVKCCKTRASYGFHGQLASHCAPCAEDGMRDVSSKKCVKCCEKQANFGFPGQQQSTHCALCAEDGMTNVKSKKCVKCRKTVASYGFYGQHASHCASCAEDGMENVVSKRCVKCCKSRASFAKPGQKQATHCAHCADDGMEDVKSKKCAKCKKTTASFGLHGRRATHCAHCADDGMENVKSKKCVKCRVRGALFAIPGDRATHCASCADDGMEDVRSKKCVKCCKTRAGYGFPGGRRPTHCASCAENVMEDVKSKKCVKCCKKLPSYGFPGERRPTHCASCAEDGMENVIKKKCPGGHTSQGEPFTCPFRSLAEIKKYRGQCMRCFCYTFPEDATALKSKQQLNRHETKVRFSIEENFGKNVKFTFDKRVALGDCKDCTVGRRPDALTMIDTVMLCIETDENQHQSYAQMDEEMARYNDLMMNYTAKWIYIRFNPDCFVSAQGRKRNPNLEERLPILIAEIQKQINRIKSGEIHQKEEYVEIIYLFYDGYDCDGTKSVDGKRNRLALSGEH